MLLGRSLNPNVIVEWKKGRSKPEVVSDADVSALAGEKGDLLKRAL